MNRGSLVRCKVSKIIYDGEGNVFKVAYKMSEIYGSMHCQGLGMTPMFIFHVKKNVSEGTDTSLPRRLLYEELAVPGRQRRRKDR